jgi:GT2 family glycosyltransferase
LGLRPQWLGLHHQRQVFHPQRRVWRFPPDKSPIPTRHCTFAKFADPIPSQSQLNSGKYFPKRLISDNTPQAGFAAGFVHVIEHFFEGEDENEGEEDLAGRVTPHGGRPPPQLL